MRVYRGMSRITIKCPRYPQLSHPRTLTKPKYLETPKTPTFPPATLDNLYTLQQSICVLTVFAVFFVAVEEHCCTGTRLPCQWRSKSPEHPELFTHCCKYSDWSEWKIIPDSVTDGDQSYQEIRYRLAKRPGCTNQIDKRWICKLNLKYLYTLVFEYMFIANVVGFVIQLFEPY